MFWSDTELVQTGTATLTSTDLHPLKTVEKYHIQLIFLTGLSEVYFNRVKLFSLWEENIQSTTWPNCLKALMSKDVFQFCNKLNN